ncbi:SAM-dependent methyltransferase [Wenxinia marina]|uniref:Cyclopropane fatty acid synthase n=1 Tax=Wenxinia marina DSM 24838 TaxID=1123501 RepID=A0A0D0PDY6_9RHOB|nr:cyclopropane-fatty-acyl-phospholipid synthase family protein [Wenxinia marina]KIQ69631.1 Cyclopropane fatty acid synthase [Wenxinia marina DSM 24838]GGL59898.1 cyclopropane-fatty-acyl-phospholipid synthase [Wenxinia marina]
MWTDLFHRAMSRFIRDGALTIDYPDGTRRAYGDGSGPPVLMRITDPALLREILLKPELALGEGYVDGGWDLGEGTLADFFKVVLSNQRAGRLPKAMEVWGALLRPAQKFIAHNRISAARANVHHHYDLSGALYDLFLDADRQYSCAYFARPDMTLEEAQEAKKHHIARKLRIEPGMRVLDIGCGWGGMALTLARDYGAEVVGVTLSTEQLKVATERATAAGLGGRIDIRLQDYRELTGQFDRIVSVGMFEHVGLPHYGTYFGAVKRLMAPGGVALIHTIGVAGPPQATGEWIRRYIFPGGYLPSLSEVVRAIEKADLPIADIEILRNHYGHTLRHWADRFEAHEDEAERLYDARFVRMWRYYLEASGASFFWGRNVNFQVQIEAPKGTVPITRDYLYADAPA